QSLLQWRIAVGRTKIQDIDRFAAQHRVDAELQLLDGKVLRCRTRHHKGNRVHRHTRHDAIQNLLAAFIGKKQLPTDAFAATKHGRRGGSDFQAIAVAANKGAAANMALNESFRFEFGVGVRNGCAVNAEHRGELAARWDAVARAQITGMDEGAQLVAKLDVQGNVALRLQMNWKHWHSPVSQF